MAEARIHASTIELRVSEEHLDAIRGDACCSLLGELLAPLLPVARVEGELASEVEEAARLYLARVCTEELARLARLFGEASHLVTVPVTTPLLIRVSRLARFYPWLRTVYGEALNANPRLLRDRCLEAARSLGLRVRGYLIEGVEAAEAHRSQPRRFEAMVASAAGLLTQLASPHLVSEGLSTPLHPLLRDPLAGVRVAGAPVALKTMSFEDQLYIITGVSRALAVIRGGGIRAARKVEVGGFVTAIVKDYRSPIAAKWLLAAILTLHLPKPRLAPRRRMNAEILYTTILADEGFNVHGLLLVDPRRLKAAFRYVEGEDLTAVLKRTGTPPQYRDLGVLLAQLHSKQISLWDTNPSNFVISRTGYLYVVDLEQARRLGSVEEAAWDIAMGIYYSALYGPRDAPTRAKMLAEGYLDAGGDRRVVEEAAKPKYMLPFIMAVAPSVLERCRRALLYAAGL